MVVCCFLKTPLRLRCCCQLDSGCLRMLCRRVLMRVSPTELLSSACVAVCVRSIPQRRSTGTLLQSCKFESSMALASVRDTLALVEPRARSYLSTAQFATGPKRSMGHFLGAEKINFFNSRYRRSHQGGRVSGILSIRGPEVSLGSPRSVLDMGNRLRRMRGCFPLQIHLPRCISSHLSIAQNAKVLDPELSGELQARPHAG